MFNTVTLALFIRGSIDCDCILYKHDVISSWGHCDNYTCVYASPPPAGLAVTPAQLSAPSYAPTRLPVAPAGREEKRGIQITYQNPILKNLKSL